MLMWFRGEAAAFSDLDAAAAVLAARAALAKRASQTPMGAAVSLPPDDLLSSNRHSRRHFTGVPLLCLRI